MRVIWMLLAVILAGCGGGEARRGPDPLTLLQVGVDAEAEAEDVRRGLEGAGWALVRRIAAGGWVAMSFEQPSTGGSVVRVVTRRGTAFALDVPASGAGQPLLLLETHTDRHLVIGRADPVHDRTCLAVLGVDGEGRVAEVPIELEEGACIEGVSELGPGSGLSARVVLRMPELGRGGRIPTIAVPHLRIGGRYAPAPERFERYWEAERARRTAELSRARQARDVTAAHVLGIELAALERARGAPAAQQVSTFDAAIEGLVLSESEARAVREARATIAGGWQR